MLVVCGRPPPRSSTSTSSGPGGARSRSRTTERSAPATCSSSAASSDPVPPSTEPTIAVNVDVTNVRVNSFETFNPPRPATSRTFRRGERGRERRAQDRNFLVRSLTFANSVETTDSPRGRGRKSSSSRKHIYTQEIRHEDFRQARTRTVSAGLLAFPLASARRLPAQATTGVSIGAGGKLTVAASNVSNNIVVSTDGAFIVVTNPNDFMNAVTPAAPSPTPPPCDARAPGSPTSRSARATATTGSRTGRRCRPRSS